MLDTQFWATILWSHLVRLETLTTCIHRDAVSDLIASLYWTHTYTYILIPYTRREKSFVQNVYLPKGQRHDGIDGAGQPARQRHPRLPTSTLTVSKFPHSADDTGKLAFSLPWVPANFPKVSDLGRRSSSPPSRIQPSIPSDWRRWTSRSVNDSRPSQSSISDITWMTLQLPCNTLKK